jgi:AcrR family transcriptional regulator
MKVMDLSRTVNRQMVLEVSARLFAERGYHGTSMKEIGAALAVRAPSLYNHLSSKQDALVSIMDTAMNRALAAQDESLAGIKDVSEQLRRATESLVLDFLRHPDEVTVCNVEIRSLEEPYRSAIIAKRDQYGRRVRAIIESGCRSGRFGTPAPRLASFAVLEMGNSAKAWFNPRGSLSDAQVAEQYADFALRIVDDRGLAPESRRRTAGVARNAGSRNAQPRGASNGRVNPR